MGTHRASGEHRAIKELSEELLSDPDFADGLLQAVIATRRLDHLNILKTHELIENSGRIFVVMDLVSGLDLSRVFANMLDEEQPLPVELAANIGLQICAGLDHAHRQPNPLIHGALWPQNVLLDLDGRVRLADFGVSVAPPDVTRGESSIRTRYLYRTPEHLAGVDLTARSDVFGVGVLLYQMVTGQPAFIGETVMQTVERLQTGEVAFDDVPPVLRDVLRSALAVEAHRRPAAVVRLAGAIRRAVAAPASNEAVARLVEQILVPQVALPQGEIETLVNGGGAQDQQRHATADEPTAVDPQPSRCATSSAFDPDEPTSVEDGSVAIEPELEAGPTQISRPPRGLDELDADSHCATLPAEQTAKTVPNAPLDEVALFGEPDPDTATETLVEKARRSEGERARPTATTGPLPNIDPYASATTLRAPRVALAPAPLPGRQQARAGDEATGVGIDEEDPSRVGTRPWTVTPHQVPGDLDLPCFDDSAVTSDALDVDPAPLGPVPSSSSLSAVGETGVSSLVSGYSHVSDPSGVSISGVSTSGGSISGVSTSNVPYDDAYDSAISSFDSDGASLSLRPARIPADARRGRFTPAHVLLLIAVLVFLLASGLLARRLLRPRAAPEVAPGQVVDASLRLDQALAAAAGRRADAALPGGREADAAIRATGPRAATLPPATQPQPPQPQQRVRRLRIVSDPRGMVYVGTRQVGHSPVMVDLSAGKQPADVLVTVVASRHRVHRQPVRVARHETRRLRVALEPATYPRSTARRRGILKVRCRPGDWRRVLVNNSDSGFSCPKIDYALWPGRYRISFHDFLRDETTHRRVLVRPQRTQWLRLRRGPRPLPE